jgi:hypothetical protein
VSHPIYRVRAFEIVGPYVLCVVFDDGTARTIDFEPILAGEVFGPLRDPTLFRQVRLDPESEHVDAFVSRARSWAAAGPRSA